MDTKEYRKNVELFSASLLIAEKFFNDGILTEEEFENIKKKLMKKYDIEYNSIFAQNELI